MIGNLIHKMLKKNRAPEWFCADLKNNVPEHEIREKIRDSINYEVDIRGYDRSLWTEDFINKSTMLYYKFFSQLYMQSA